MKKIVASLLTVSALAIAGAYVFIPSTIRISSLSESSKDIKPAYRYLVNGENWPKWWPGMKPFQYNDMSFHITKKKLNSFEIQLLYKKDTIITTLEMIPLNSDSTAYTWSCKIESSKNPFKRWMQYFNATQIKKSLDFLTGSLKNYLENDENIYGFKVQKIKVIDSVLISTRSTFDHYPGTEEIGKIVQLLKDYIQKEKAIEKNYPMLNVHQLSTDKYEAMVAIATERLLPATSDFAPKLILKGGNILEAGFKGGPYAIKKGFEEFENYKDDKKFVSPAIPYQLMITDRAKEKDTANWVTKFYYPVF